MSWTDERIEKLTKMWESGATASQIADELGAVSRNAVIGKAHRLGLKARPSPVKPVEKEAKARPVKKAKAPAVAPAAREAKPVDTPARVEPEPAPAAPEPAAPPPPSAEAASDAPAPAAPERPRIVSVGPGGFLRRSAGADPARAAAQAGSGKAQPGNRRQDQPAGSQRPHLPLADGPSGRAGFPLLRRKGEPRLPILRRTLWPGLSGAAAARCTPPTSAAAFRRPARALIDTVAAMALRGRGAMFGARHDSWRRGADHHAA